ncbi:MAG: 8-oxo-dGTP diphosphatase [Firmicutes bacterium]|nr:8-oxo-dGTP diphosphatase [Bacillota bacterium]
MIDTTLCYIKKEGSWLLLFRNKKENDLNEGKWIGVGGKCEPGETPEQCVRRETLEETGLILGKVCCRGVVHFRSDTWEDEEMYLYTSEEFSGELDENCAEGTLAWIPEDQVMSLPMWEGDRLFLPELLEGAAAIEMTVVYEGDRLKAWY